MKSQENENEMEDRSSSRSVPHGNDDFNKEIGSQRKSVMLVEVEDYAEEAEAADADLRRHQKNPTMPMGLDQERNNDNNNNNGKENKNNDDNDNDNNNNSSSDESSLSSSSSTEEKSTQITSLPTYYYYYYKERLQEWTDRNINEHLRFALRVTLALTISSLFVLCQEPYPNEIIPSPFWVYITAGVTSFRSQPDLGSVYQKSWQRFVGTVIGGILGLVVGSFALLMPPTTTTSSSSSSSSDSNPLLSEDSYTWLALYLGTSQVLLSFVIVYVSSKYGYRSHYAAVLGTVTAGMALLAFYDTDNHESWKKGTYRIVNIAVGGIIGSLASILVFPISTKYLIETKVKELIEITGVAAMEVLGSTTEKLNNGGGGGGVADDYLPSYNALVSDPDCSDSSYDAYIKSIEGLNKVKGLLPLLDYDLSFKRKSSEEKRRCVQSWKMILDRLLRIQMSIVWLDNILRSKLVGDDVLRSDLLNRVGRHIQQLLDVSHRSRKERHEIAIQILNDDAKEIRKEIERIVAVQATGVGCDDDVGNSSGGSSRRSGNGQRRRRYAFATTMLDDPTVSTEDMIAVIGRFDDAGNEQYKNLFIEKQTDTFYRMVEILILRCLRQHHLNASLLYE